MAEMMDPTTARMRAETGHDCPACSTRARDLHATAHNALNAWDASGLRGSWASTRLARKMEGLRGSVARMQEIVDGHFAAMELWRRP